MSLLYRRELSLIRTYLSDSTTSGTAAQTQNDFLSIHGAIFDMDGTLTKPTLNFSEMRAAIGIPPAHDILGYINALSCEEEKRRALKIIEDIEERANQKMELQPGVLEILNFLASKNIKRAILTRNSQHSIDLLISKLQGHLTSSSATSTSSSTSCTTSSSYPHLVPSEIFSKVVSRDFKPQKPDPAPVLHICEEWSLHPKHVLVIGDGKADVLSGHRAGAVTALFVNEPQEGVSTYQPDDSTPCDIIVTSFYELMDQLKSPITIATKNIN